MKKNFVRKIAAAAVLCLVAGIVHAQSTEDLERELSEMIKDGASQEEIIKMMQQIAGQEMEDGDEIMKSAMEFSKQYMENLIKQDTPLTTAARNGNVAEVERLIKSKKVDVNAVDGSFGFTALMHAAQHNRADIAKLLINAGAKVNQKNKNDVSALFVAASSNAPDVAKLLISAGADINYVQKGDGYTPLSVAAQDTCFEVAKVLVEAGADVNKRINSIIREDKKTALMVAAGNGAPKVVKLLVDAGADVNARDINDFTPLHHWGGGFQDSSVEVGRVLIAAKANVNAKNKYGETVLMSAASGCSAASMKMLISAGADVNAKNKEGKTALMNASKQRSDSVGGVKVLIAAKANLNAQDNYGNTALMYAASRNAANIARTLLAAGANPDIKDKDGCTALMEAAKAYDGGPEVAQVIIAGGANINARDNSGHTALWWGENVSGWVADAVADVVRRAGGKK